MGRTIGVSTLLKKEYKTYPLSQEWVAAIGPVEQCFKMLIWGPAGGGKTTFAMQLCKELARHGKVYYNSVEQGEGKSLQDVAMHVKMDECRPGRFMIGDRDTFDEMMDKLQRNRARFVVIDSAQYINLTTERYKRMIDKYPRKAFIIISWAGVGEQPKGEYAKAIRYMADIKTCVRNGVARSDSRFGQTKPHNIFDKAPQGGDQLALLNH